MRLKLKQLEYAQTNYFTIPYLPHVFYAVVICLLGILIPLNIALVGSDVVTTLRSDPTVEVNPWWMPKSWPKALRLTLPQTCQPISITDDTPLRTNSSVPLFLYVLRYASQNGTETDPSNRIYPAPYMGNPLKDCEITTITLNLQLPIVLFTYTFGIRCSLGGKKDYSFRVPDNLTFTATHRRARNADMGEDDMVNYLAFNTIPVAGQIFEASPALKALPSNNSSPNNVLGVLDAIQYDLIKAIWAQRWIYWHNNWTYHTMNVVEWAAGSMCTSGDGSRELNTPCNGIADHNRIIRWYETTEGLAMNVREFVSYFNVTLSNVFITLHNALMRVYFLLIHNRLLTLATINRLDLGHIDPTANIYLNKSYFDSSIQTDPFFTDALPIVTTLESDGELWTPLQFWQSCTWGWGCVNDTSWADALRKAPENTGVNNLVLPWKPSQNLLNQPSVLSFSYLCPTLQKKSTGSLLTAVFVATATMLGVLYSIFEVLMPKVERRYLRRQAARGRLVNPNDADRQEALALVGHSRTRESSGSTYYEAPLTEMPDKYDKYDYPYSAEYPPANAGPYTYSTHNNHGH